MFASANLINPTLEPPGPVEYSWGRQPDPPPCSCVECAQQYRKLDEQFDTPWVYTGAINNGKADAVCNEMIQSINDNRAFLQHQLAIRASDIAKRWKKKTWKNRESLLKTADPEMYDGKWHEGHISYEARYGSWLTEARKHQHIHLLPYMSLESLKEDPSRLIKLLQLRAKHSPADLAVHDNRRLTFAWTAGILKTTFNASAIVMYGQHYGSLVSAVSYSEWISFLRSVSGALVYDVPMLLEHSALLLKLPEEVY
jgi:hypothetical protein